jgi:hypothetical protein
MLFEHRPNCGDYVGNSGSDADPNKYRTPFVAPVHLIEVGQDKLVGIKSDFSADVFRKTLSFGHCATSVSDDSCGELNLHFGERNLADFEQVLTHTDLVARPQWLFRYKLAVNKGPVGGAFVFEFETSLD